MPLDKPLERAIVWDILVQQGSTFERTMDFEGLDLAGLSLRGEIRREHRAAEVLAEFSFEVELPNTVTVTLTPAQTALLPPGRLVHDIELFTPADQFVARVLEGRVTVTPEVTRG